MGNSNRPSSLPSFSNLPSLYSRLPSDNPGSKLPHNRRGSSTLTDSKAGSTLISLLRLYYDLDQSDECEVFDTDVTECFLVRLSVIFPGSKRKHTFYKSMYLKI